MAPVATIFFREVLPVNPLKLTSEVMFILKGVSHTMNFDNW